MTHLGPLCDRHFLGIENIWHVFYYMELQALQKNIVWSVMYILSEHCGQPYSFRESLSANVDVAQEEGGALG